MTLFRAQIDAYFYADDIEDALRKLANHLVAPIAEDASDEEQELFVPPSHVDIRPAGDDG